ncbi:hypothetical protein HBI56_014240 [Parastagonospora nodorum]|uniref:Uncharacterized protein n=1 Tax=Phaeosphaeria nodorum (strain SN15 / ATCC MYA-4574 / FGSC 10173) TaxID=321614 RepID=A0A7U2F3H6_PHANO|nr:hypothetical protein HBH56_085750 [Parastagonospora nodorum]QRC96918.1 hypothetical protein JI435_409760 [Parastagonospora nodorum SN15]KAH3929961.1 hypothetical protein HBH54_116080 [Parastagonospora nodorum]KAH3955550.1 hypothetical protein HBH53_008510 [Parastagonospora nodorum]KAH3982313.1 hypothetical protein HBH52_081460 [Parastagonospora nodorum]
MFKRPFLAFQDAHSKCDGNYLPRHNTASCASLLDMKLTTQRMTARRYLGSSARQSPVLDVREFRMKVICWRGGRMYPAGEDMEPCDVHGFSQLAF